MIFSDIGKKPTIEETDVLVGEGGTTKVYRDVDGKYFIVDCDVVRHPDCDAETVMRALCHYLSCAPAWRENSGTTFRPQRS